MRSFEPPDSAADASIRAVVPLVVASFGLAPRLERRVTHHRRCPPSTRERAA
jgi:hypothetical protein